MLPSDALIYYPIPMSVFKTYDIRGVWGSEIDDSLAYRLGRGLARSMKVNSFLLGYDARLHSPELYQALASGLVEEGSTVSGPGLPPLLSCTSRRSTADSPPESW